MAFDGLTVAALRHELNSILADGRISKISQPEQDELILTVKTGSGQERLLISASATLPLVYLTDTNKPAPPTAPAFCMLLRKHLSGARILSVTQPGLERVLHINMEHRDEMGDLCRKCLIIEIMGKHSNIIFTDEKDMIIDSIKHISAAVSSVREVLPGRDYFLPETVEKADPLTVTREELRDIMSSKAMPLYKALYTSFIGISPQYAQELCYASGTDADLGCNLLDEEQNASLHNSISAMARAVETGSFAPEIIYEHEAPAEYCVLHMTSYEGCGARHYDSVSRLLQDYYAEKNTYVNIRQRSSDLRHIVTTALERNVKKYDLQVKQMQDTEKKDKYKVWGELLNAYGYSAAPGDKSITILNYYTGKEETIPLDETLTASQNAQKYYDRYNKLKRTYEALSTLTVEVSMEIEHLESVLNALDIARSEDDLIQIREELIESGLIRRKNSSKKVRILSKPFHYVTDDGFHIYVGKNNLQNDELTFKLANGSDWWFHAKKIPGSHVILKTEGREVPDHVFELAAAAAAYYCKGSEQDKVEIDYVQRREVKKPAGAKPGFVVYYTNYSMAIAPGISELTPVDQ
ncbi:MAG: NFACT family protein [Lachnospiraceae bacterium]|nr:NFACT family protein [Lachnospiraceae bacterium]